MTEKRHDPIRCMEDSLAVTPIIWIAGAITVHSFAKGQALHYAPVVFVAGIVLAPFLFHAITAIENWKYRRNNQEVLE